MIWSHTKLKTLEECPLRFKKIYIDKEIKEDEYEGFIEGRFLHELFYKALEERMDVSEYGISPKALQVVNDLLVNAKSWAFEQEFMLDGDLVRTDDPEKAIYRGRADIVIRCADDKVYILDLKNDYDGRFKTMEKEQLSGYALAFQEENTIIGKIALRSGFFDVEELDEKKIYNRMRVLKHRIETAENLVKWIMAEGRTESEMATGRGCIICPYKYSCLIKDKKPTEPTELAYLVAHYKELASSGEKELKKHCKLTGEKLMVGRGGFAFWEIEKMHIDDMGLYKYLTQEKGYTPEQLIEAGILKFDRRLTKEQAKKDDMIANFIHIEQGYRWGYKRNVKGNEDEG